MSLPANVKPWMEWLQHFDQQLAQLLGQVLLQLEPLFPQPKARPMASVDEFDGFNGIINRGQYHRLLASEWVLADDMPDEFMRRAVEHEHHFLAPQLKEPRNDGTCLVLFDAGVHQLGSLRIFHVAMWILLAQRALQRGAEFRWAIAQQPDMVHTDSTVDALKKLLNARTLSLVTADMQQQWLDYLDDKNNQVAEQWWVGCPEAVTSLPARLCPNRVSLQRLILANQVHIELATRAVFRQLRVAEPQGKPFNKLLKGQFKQLPELDLNVQQNVPAQESQLLPQQSLYISPCSTYIALICRDRRAKVWRIPKQPQIKMKLLSQNQFIDEKQGSFIAPLFAGKDFGGLFRKEDGLYGWMLPALGGYQETEHRLVRQPGRLQKMPAVLQASTYEDSVYVLDDTQTLVQWCKDRKQQQQCVVQKIVAQQVLALLVVDKTYLVHAQVHEQKELRLIRRHLSGQGSHAMLLHKAICHQPISKVLLCRNISWQSKQDTAWALYISKQNLWQLGYPGLCVEQNIQLSKKYRVIALIEDQEDQLALLVLEPERRRIELAYSAHQTEVLVSSGSEILHVDVHGDHLAWVTADQRIQVMNLRTQAVLCSMDIGG